MPIYKKHRTLSEKTTSIEDPIEIKQSGVIQFAPADSAAGFLIPTTVTNVVGLRINGLSAVTNYILGASGAAAKKTAGWWSDLTLHYATHAASLAFGSMASAVAPTAVGKRLKMHNGKLYTALASLAEGSCSTTGFVTSLASGNWRQLEEFGSNAQKYLVVTLGNGVTLFASVRHDIAYEVIGYEY